MSAASDDREADFDARLIALRRAGKSYGTMAREMKLARAHDATEEFIRAVRQSAPTERTVLRDEEVARLDKLEDRVRAKQDLEPLDRDRRINVITRLRARLLEP